MTVHPDALPVLAGAIETVVSEVGFNTAADAEYIAKQLDAVGFDIVPRLRDLPAGVRPLNDRQREVLLLLACDLSNLEIAARLWLSEGAVKSRVKDLFAVLCAQSRLDAVLCAVELGHVSLGELLAARAELADAKAAS